MTMTWKSIAEDIVMQVILADPCKAGPGMVNFCRAALLGVGQLPDCPGEYLPQVEQLDADYVRLSKEPGAYVEWNQVSIETHELLAKLAGCEAQTTSYYDTV